MYAGEAPGGKFPPLGDESYSADDVNDWNCGPVANPHGPAIYPEYLSDMKVYFCPSDALSEPDEFLKCPGGEWCDANGQLDPEGFDDRSYNYYGWVAENDIVWGCMVIASTVAMGQTTAKDTCGQARDGDLTLTSDVAAYFVFYRDMVVAKYPQYAAYSPMGNAGGESIMRMKEGVERFMITDINNPAASAKAQSSIATMWDVVKGSLGDDPSDVGEFHHVPGGANALYMDGHVEFKKYPSYDIVDIPVTPLVAAFGRAY